MPKRKDAQTEPRKKNSSSSSVPKLKKSKSKKNAGSYDQNFVIGAFIAGMVAAGILWYAVGPNPPLITHRMQRTAAEKRALETYRYEDFHLMGKVFTPAECQRIIDYIIKDHPDWLTVSNIGGHSKVENRNDNIRRTETCPIPKTPKMMWAYKKVGDAVREANRVKFGVNGLGANANSELVEMMQFSSYRAERRGMYTWHDDIGKQSRSSKRRLSFTVQLSDPDVYDGGNLQIMDRPDVVYTMSKQQGSATVFKSGAIHRVDNVTRGIRYSLVGWFQVP